MLSEGVFDKRFPVDPPCFYETYGQFCHIP